MYVFETALIVAYLCMCNLDQCQDYIDNKQTTAVSVIADVDIYYLFLQSSL